MTQGCVYSVLNKAGNHLISYAWTAENTSSPWHVISLSKSKNHRRSTFVQYVCCLSSWYSTYLIRCSCWEVSLASLCKKMVSNNILSLCDKWARSVWTHCNHCELSIILPKSGIAEENQLLGYVEAICVIEDPIYERPV